MAVDVCLSIRVRPLPENWKVASWKLAGRKEAHNTGWPIDTVPYKHIGEWRSIAKLNGYSLSCLRDMTRCWHLRTPSSGFCRKITEGQGQSGQAIKLFQMPRKISSTFRFWHILSCFTTWNLQSYTTTVLNERMWHFRGSKHDPSYIF